MSCPYHYRHCHRYTRQGDIWAQSFSDTREFEEQTEESSQVSAVLHTRRIVSRDGRECGRVAGHVSRRREGARLRGTDSVVHLCDCFIADAVLACDALARRTSHRCERCRLPVPRDAPTLTLAARDLLASLSAPDSVSSSRDRFSRISAHIHLVNDTSPPVILHTPTQAHCDRFSSDLSKQSTNHR